MTSHLGNTIRKLKCKIFGHTPNPIGTNKKLHWQCTDCKEIWELKDKKEWLTDG